jgi:hypothetical protein
MPIFMLNTRYSCQMLMKLEFYGQILDKYSNIKFHENPSGGNSVVHANGRTDMTKLKVAFRNFTNGPKNTECIFLLCRCR